MLYRISLRGVALPKMNMRLMVVGDGCGNYRRENVRDDPQDSQHLPEEQRRHPAALNTNHRWRRIFELGSTHAFRA
jgi:hypothetical protein